MKKPERNIAPEVLDMLMGDYPAHAADTLTFYGFHLHTLFNGAHHHVLRVDREISQGEVAAWRRVAEEATAIKARNEIPKDDAGREQIARRFAQRFLNGAEISPDYWGRAGRSWHRVASGFADYTP